MVRSVKVFLDLTVVRYHDGMTFVFSSDIDVHLVKHSASDDDVVKAALVSTSKEESDYDEEKRRGLINYLMRERHGSPFEHSIFTFYVKAPIFVWREHMRHRIASYNEESGRYSVLKPEFYIPSPKRNIVQIGKTGNYEFIPGNDIQYILLVKIMKEDSKRLYLNYHQLLDEGVCKEVARMSLPLNIYSRSYVTINARSLMNFLSLRVKSEDSLFKSYPQREIEMVAERYEEIFSKIMPITYKAFVDNKRVQP